jgi:cell division protein FtsQ
MSNAAAIKARAAGAAAGPAGRAGGVPRLARVLLAALCAGIAAFFLVRYAALPLLTIRNVVVAGQLPFSREDALRIAGLREAESWLSVPCPVIQKRLEANPLVRRALVEKIFPSTVRLTVDRRLPAALVLGEAEGRSVPLLVDGDGYLFKVGASGAEMDLTVVSGIEAGEIRLGTGLPRSYAAVFADLQALRDSSPSLAALLSEVRLGAAGGAEPDLVLYLTTTSVPVRARGPIDATLLRYTLMVLDLLSKQGILNDIQELDFRSGQVVYRMKEG